MMEKLGCVIYASLTDKGYSVSDAKVMLKAARQSRCLLGLTGVAVFANGMIMTLIEGQADQVYSYYKSVTSYIGGGLHNVIKLMERPISKRSFDDYCLGFKSYEEHLIQLDDFSEGDGKIFFENFLAKESTVSKMVKGFITDQAR